MHCEGTDLTKANTGKNIQGKFPLYIPKILTCYDMFIITYHIIYIREIVIICELLYADTAISKVLINQLIPNEKKGVLPRNPCTILLACPWGVIEKFPQAKAACMNSTEHKLNTRLKSKRRLLL